MEATKTKKRGRPSKKVLIESGDLLVPTVEETTKTKA